MAVVEKYFMHQRGGQSGRKTRDMRERVKPDRLQLRQFTEGADSKVIVTMTLL